MPANLTDSVFIEPLDVLVLRGNKLFADAASHGEALMPPWPSVAAGALRSRMLVDAGVSPAEFAAGRATLGQALEACLGSVQAPGSFRIAHFGLARETSSIAEALLPMPADLVVDDAGRPAALRPQAMPATVASSYPLPLIPVLAQPRLGKARTGLWLTAAGIAAWQAGRSPAPGEWLTSAELWTLDSRLGIALAPGQNTVVKGQLYTSEAIALKPGVGFVARVQGVDRGTLPTAGSLRFGGDGHAASVRRCTAALPELDPVALGRAGRFRIMLTSPGIFGDGWKLAGTDANGRWHFQGASARLACAAVPRLETLSGWDVARGMPKPALRAAPAGSVYWLDDFQGDPRALAVLQRDGLALDDAARRAEGFNNCLLAEWR